MKSLFYKVILPFSLTTIFLFQSLKNVRFDIFLNYLESLSLIKIVIPIIVLFIDHSLRVFRWEIILSCKNEFLRFRDCFKPYFISLFLNNIIPMRSGDIYRSFYFKNKNLKILTSEVVGSLLIERFFDFLIISIFFCIGYLNLIKNGYSFETNTRFENLFFLFLIISFIIIFTYIFRYPIYKFLYRIPSFRNLFDRILLAFKNIFNLIISLKKNKKLLSVFLLSLISWSLEGMYFLRILNGDAKYFFNWFGSWFVMSFATLSTLIPSSPGYIGTFHFFTIKGLEAYGLPTNMASNYSFMIHASLWLPLTLFGLILFSIDRLKVKKNN